MVSMNVKDNESQQLRKIVKWFGIIGGLMSGGSGCLIWFFPIIVSTILNSQLVIKEGNKLTEGWQNVPIPVTTKLFIWSLENPVQFVRGAKPQLKEMGPYVYSMRLRKDIISWGPNNESVKYWMYCRWNFDKSRTIGNLNDQVTILNVPAYAAAAVVKNLVDKIPFSFAFGPFVYGLINNFFSAHRERLIKQTTVRNLIEGSRMGMVQTINFLLKPLKWLGIQLPGADQLKLKVPQNKFGLLLMFNNSRMGPYEIWTGQSDPKKFDKFISYKGKRVLDFYGDPKCNQIKGTEGISFGSFLKKEDVLYLFFSDACRSMYVTYKGLSHVRGIPTWRYRLPPSIFASPDKNPDNKCFCTTPRNYQKCDGILDIGPCQMGAPLALSFPHLLYSGRKIQSGVEGIAPDPHKHEAYFDINPILGIPVEGRVRLQFNVLTKRMPILGSSRIRETVLPFVWIEIAVGVSGSYEWLMRFGSYALLIGEWGPFFSLFSGFSLLSYSSYLLVMERRVIFKQRSEVTPIQTFGAIDGPLESKLKYLYPNTNLFTIEGIESFNKLKNSNHINGGQQSGGQIPLLNGVMYESTKGRARLSPPGAIE